MRPEPIFSARIGQWIVLLTGSAAAGIVFDAIGFPAGTMLGAMICGILIALNGGEIRLSKKVTAGSHALLGCLIATAIQPAVLPALIKQWPLITLVILVQLASAGWLGWAMSRRGILPGSTAVWGMSPGASAAMVAMADAYGADARLVAFMQYFRLFIVATIAMCIGTFFVIQMPGVASGSPMLATVPLTLAVAAVAGIAGWYSRIPSGTLLLPLVAAGLLQICGVTHLDLPGWMAHLTYAVVGWGIGLSFTKDVFAHAFRALPRIAGSMAAMVAISAGLAVLLIVLLHTDPLTAFLATSPGGLDSVSAIALASNADVSFVLALQTTRFVLVTAFAPTLAGYIAKRVTA